MGRRRGKIFLQLKLKSFVSKLEEKQSVAQYQKNWGESLETIKNVENKEKNQSHGAANCERVRPFEVFQYTFCCKISKKNIEVGPCGKSVQKNLTMPKKLKGGPFSLIRLCMSR